MSDTAFAVYIHIVKPTTTFPLLKIPPTFYRVCIKSEMQPFWSGALVHTDPVWGGPTYRPIYSAQSTSNKLVRVTQLNKKQSQ